MGAMRVHEPGGLYVSGSGTLVRAMIADGPIPGGAPRSPRAAWEQPP